MSSVAVSAFRSDILLFLKKVMQGEEITITARGQEVARLVPPLNKTVAARKALQKLRATSKVGDVVSPIEASWKVT
jgi:prevent-host-death family protein